MSRIAIKKTGYILITAWMAALAMLSFFFGNIVPVLNLSRVLYLKKFFPWTSIIFLFFIIILRYLTLKVHVCSMINEVVN